MRLSILLSLLPLALAAPAPLLQPRGAAKLIADKYIVKFKDGSALKSLDDTLSTFSDKAEHVFRGAFKGFSATLDAESLDVLRDHSDVEYIEQDAIFTANTYVQQINAPWGLARISHRAAGSTIYVYDDSSGAGTCSYILDTGIDATHPEFGGRATQLASFAGDNSPDANGHGTHVAGIIGAQTYGVAKATLLFGIKVLDASGSGSTSGIISGMNLAVQDSGTRSCPNGAFANMSLGGGFSAALNAAAAAMVSNGVFLAVAAGNEASDASNFSPASEPSVCTVGSSDISDNVASSSNYGPVVDIYAPGRDITSTWIDGSVQTISGTSMASPHITGLAAYLAALEGNPGSSAMCGRIQELATEGVLSGVPSGTLNLLAFNGNPTG